MIYVTDYLNALTVAMRSICGFCGQWNEYVVRMKRVTGEEARKLLKTDKVDICFNPAYKNFDPEFDKKVNDELEISIVYADAYTFYHKNIQCGDTMLIVDDYHHVGGDNSGYLQCSNEPDPKYYQVTFTHK